MTMLLRSERVRAVRADRELELEQELVGVDAFGVVACGGTGRGSG